MERLPKHTIGHKVSNGITTVGFFATMPFVGAAEGRPAARFAALQPPTVGQVSLYPETQRTSLQENQILEQKVQEAFGLQNTATPTRRGIANSIVPLEQQIPEEINNPNVCTPEYTVVDGDNLYSIGLANGVPWEKIAEANNIAAPYTIHPKESLVIPCPDQPQQLQNVKPVATPTTTGDNPLTAFAEGVKNVGIGAACVSLIAAILGAGMRFFGTKHENEAIAQAKARKEKNSHSDAA